MSENYFCFKKDNPIVIYGANRNGIDYYRQLVSNGYHILCFIDRKAKEYGGMLVIEGEEVTVFDAERINELDREVIFLIAIRNVIEQNKVAKNLWQKDFQNVIYFPTMKEDRRKKEALNILKTFYGEFTGGRIRENGMLPKQRMLWESDPFWDHAIIEQNDEHIIAWIPTSLIHFYNLEMMENMVCTQGITLGTEMKYFDRSVFQLEWLNDLFNFFINGEGDLSYYWEVEKMADNYVKQQSTKENQLWFSDRQQCADRLMSGMNTGCEFTIQSAIPVQWNEKGYFNICDGGHRLAFLNCMNMNMLAARISLEDYEKWVNKKVLEECLIYIKEKGMITFEAPVPHPWFYGCEVREEKFGKTILKCILEQMMKFNLYENFSVLDINPKDGYYIQHFARISTGIITGIVYDESQYMFLTHMNKLFYLDEHIGLADMETERGNNRKYDIVLMLKKLCEFDEDERIGYIKWISAKTEKMIIWESGTEYEKEKSLILQYSPFKNYIFLKRVLSENVVREVGIFMKNIHIKTITGDAL